MADLRYDHDQMGIIDLINDSIIPLAYAIILKARELHTIRRTRIVAQTLHPGHDLFEIFLGDPIDILPDGRTNLQVIAGHVF